MKAHDGTDVAAPNCLVCHAEYFGGKLVPGLGRNSRFIATDASGFTLDVFGIGLNSVFVGDTPQQLVQALGLLSRLFQDTTHSHLFDLFAALGMRHDPDTLEWTGVYPVDDWYKVSWYGKRGTSSIVRVNGYMAPPLDGVFMTAPYFHNGSVPTLEGVIDPEKRPAVWTSDCSEDDYDYDAVGWMDKPFDTCFWTLDQKQCAYYTNEPGNSNQGHTYGAVLSPDEKKALLEYLKTL